MDPQWRGDGRELYYVSADQSLMAVAVAPGVTFKAGIPELLFRLTPDPLSLRWGFVYAPAPDGQRFVLTEVSESAQPRLIVKLNWMTDGL